MTDQTTATPQDVLDAVDRVYTEEGCPPFTEEDMVPYVLLAASIPSGTKSVKLDREAYDAWISDTLALIGEVRREHARLAALTGLLNDWDLEWGDSTEGTPIGHLTTQLRAALTGTTPTEEN